MPLMPPSSMSTLKSNQGLRLLNKMRINAEGNNKRTINESILYESTFVPQFTVGANDYPKW